MRHLRALCLSFLTLAMTAGILSARAADPPAPAAVDDAASARADELTHKGNDLALKLRWKEAEPLFREAWALKHSYDIGGNLGLAELALGKYRDAAEHLSFALKSFPANGKGPHRELLQESLGKAKGRVAMVTVEVNQKGALVVVDGKEVGRAPLADDVFVEPGSHVIEARLAEFTGAKETVEAGKGSAQTVRLALSKVAPGPAASGSASAGPAASSGAPVLPPKDDARARMRKGVIIGGASAAGVGLIAGVVFTVIANAKSSATREKAHALISAAGADACAQPSAACREVAGLFDERATFTNVAGWSFVSAGALGAATVVYALATKDGPKASVRAAPVVTANGGGFVVGGAW